MEEDKEYIDFVIRNSLKEKMGNSFAPDLSDKILKRISRDKLIRSILFDFSIKSMVVLLIFVISVLVYFGMGNQDGFWLNLAKNNFPILIGSIVILYFIFFLNEITEKFLGRRYSS